MRATCIAICFGLLSLGCAQAPLSEHMLWEKKGLHFGDWRLLDYKNFGKGGGVRYYVPPGREKPGSWSEMITVGMIVDPAISLEKYVDDSNRLYEVRCPGTKHTTIESNTNDAYYVNLYPPCNGRPLQHEITRIAKGNEAFYRLSYTVKNRELSSIEKDEWLTTFRNAYIAKGEKHERVR